MSLLQDLEHMLAAAAHKVGAPTNNVQSIIERPRNAQHGDFSSSLALRLAKKLDLAPIDIANQLATAATDHPAIALAQVAKPGFVNMQLTPTARCAVVAEALAAGSDFGRQPPNDNQILLEFVSANPTGPLHVGHGRMAAFGDSLARLLKFAGATVTTEYYLNDRGLQIDLLAASLWFRVLEQQGLVNGTPPAGTYAGTYLIDLAQEFAATHQDVMAQATQTLSLAELPTAKDAAATETVVRVRTALGADNFNVVRNFAVTKITQLVRTELMNFGVGHDRWHSEQAMTDRGEPDAAISTLTKRGSTYVKDGATWFRASDYGDTKDWVIVRANGELTYFAADIAYHLDKCKRGYKHLINVLGADHHGYVPRLRAVFAALGEDPNCLETNIIQFVALVNAGNRIKQSTRAGQFHSLRDLIDAIGVPAARLFFVLTKGDAPMDFDVAKAASQTADNPVHYLRYAHARSCSLLAKWGGDCASLGPVEPAALTERAAMAVLTELRWFPTTVAYAARERAPHRIAHWLIALASALHGYYDSVPVLAGDAAGKSSRLALVAATRLALANGLELLGIDAPNKM